MHGGQLALSIRQVSNPAHRLNTLIIKGEAENE